jgi:hypothetical protein
MLRAYPAEMPKVDPIAAHDGVDVQGLFATAGPSSQVTDRATDG